MSQLMLIGAIGFGFVNCALHRPMFFLISVICILAWFIIRVKCTGTPAGERLITLCGAGLAIAVVTDVAETHASIAEAAYFVILVIAAFLLSRFYISKS